ncbi:pyridoxamine 5'-phosphate oxidase family protein [Microbacterium album]|uniref:Pyridoxamine 5'-phosphate oxidase n=1 Tax=Microbacterium album TaxID=2053191 RepID=A0A917IBS9_9MICO|nr:pyridoxamine 5'-phosphate oxidase family protein [Microbacterium album]GGH35956.1 pyridoxamine 5'-phosphate oxidase [Microbacterium album]
MSLSETERQSFLAEPHYATISVSAGSGRGPLAVPIWYDYEPGGLVRIITGRDSRKARLIRQAARFTLLVQRVHPNPRYVSVEGPVVEERDLTEAIDSAMAHRYLPPAAAAAYLERSKSFGPQVVMDMRPEHWLSADLPPLG